jgi:hypothetical protein
MISELILTGNRPERLIRQARRRRRRRRKRRRRRRRRRRDINEATFDGNLYFALQLV